MEIPVIKYPSGTLTLIVPVPESRPILSVELLFALFEFVKETVACPMVLIALLLLSNVKLLGAKLCISLTCAPAVSAVGPP